MTIEDAGASGALPPAAAGPDSSAVALRGVGRAFGAVEALATG